MKKTTLRQQAEAKLGRQKKATPPPTALESQRLVQELQVHQVELEMQNEQLVQARAETEAALRQYADLYDFAPAGYFTLMRDGAIQQVNLTGATLLNAERGKLLKRRFGLLVSPKSRPILNAFLEKIFISGKKQICEVELLKGKTESFWAQIEAVSDEARVTCRAVLVDISARKQAEEQLVYHANLLRKISDAVIATDQTLTISSWSTAAEIIYGWNEEEALGKNLDELLHTEFLETTQAQAQKELLANNVWRGDLRQQRKNGRQIYITSAVSLLKDDKGGFTGGVTVNRDITERKQAEQALQENERRFKALIEHGTDQVILVTSDGKLIYENPTVARPLGYPAGAVLNHSIFELTHPDDLAQASQTWAEMLDQPGLGVLSAFRLRHADGSWRWMEGTATNLLDEPAVQAIVINYRDVSARKQAEESLRRSQQLLVQAEAISQSGSWMLDILSGDTKWSDGMYKLFQVPNDVKDRIGAVIERIHPDDIEGYQQEFGALLAGTALPYFDYRIILPDSGVRHISAQVSMEWDADGNPVRAVGTAQDITERKRAQAALSESQERYRSLFNVMEEGIAINEAVLDENGDVVDYIILDVNPAFERHAPYTIQEALGKRATDLYKMSPDFIRGWWRDHSQLEHAAKFEYYDEPTGNWFFITTTVPEGKRFATIFINITERKQAEAELKKLYERFKLLGEAANDAVWEWNLETNVVWSNLVHQELFGLTLTDPVPDDKEWKRRLHPEEREQIYQSLQEARASTRNIWYAEYQLKTENKGWISIYARTYIERNKEGKALRMIGSMMDITERKQAEKLQEAVYEIARAAFTTQTLDELYAKIHAVLQNILPAQYFYIALYDRKKDLLSFPYFQDAFDLPSPPGKPGRGLTEYVLQTGKPLLATHEITDELIQSGQVELIGADSSEWLGVPLIVREQIIGVMTVQSYEKAIHFSAQDLEIMTYVSSQVASAIARKQAEEKLRESESDLNTAQAVAKLGSWTNEFDTRSVSWSAEMFRLYGRDPSLGTPLYPNFLEYVHPADRQALIQNETQAIAERRSFYNEYRVLDASGGIRWFAAQGEPQYDQAGNPIRIFGTTQDITDRKQAEEKIEWQNQRLKALREIDTAILAADSVENIVSAALGHIRELIECPRAALALIDWETDETVVFDVRTANETFIPKGTRMPLALFQDMVQILSKNQQVLVNDLNTLADPPPQIQILIKEGLRSVCILPLFSQDNLIGAFSMHSEIPGFFDEEKINLGREVANQVALAITQSRLVEALEQHVHERDKLIVELTAKNAELEQFTYTVSHDLKSPLVTMKGFLGYLEQDIVTGNVERLKGDTQRIANAVDKMAQLLNDLLELSRIGRFINPPQNLPFDELAREALELVQGRIRERGVTVELQPNLPVVYGDRLRLTEVLQNLLDNAVKYMGNQTEPHIEIGQRGEDADAERGQPVFYVKDNGIGIASEYRERVFGLFNKLDARSDGTGIGLALVRRIIEFHGGRIWVESEAGSGSTFLFTLPLGQPVA